MSNHNIPLLLHRQEEILTQPSDQVPKPRSIWRHYKGDLYSVKRLVMRESTEEIDVCYKKFENSPLLFNWSRPLKEWNEMVDYNGTQVKRFVFVSSSKSS